MPVRRVLLAVSLLALTAAPLSAKTAIKAPAKAAAKPAARKAAGAPARPGIMVDPGLRQVIDDPHRKPDNVARDKYRHPAQTLTFFGLQPGMTVVEMVPGGGWYSEILIPYLADQGHYVAAVEPDEMDNFKAFLAADPDRTGKAQAIAFNPGQTNSFVPDGTADMIVTFRNIHNMLGSPDQPGDGNAPQAFADWFRALKPGGVLGIEEHRLPENMDSAREKTSGYVKLSTVVRLATAAGFQWAGASNVNANPRDDHDHPDGVWDLPPTYKAGDKDKAKYAAIGESDRMTLRFVKPDPNAPAASDAPPAEQVAPDQPSATPRLSTDPAALGEQPQSQAGSPQ
jgi:predicted methyltransferase